MSLAINEHWTQLASSLASDLPITSILTRALQNSSRIKTNYSRVKANCSRVLVDTCREIFDYSRARLKLELSSTVATVTYRIRQNIRGGNLSLLQAKPTICWKTFMENPCCTIQSSQILNCYNATQWIHTTISHINALI